MSLLEKKKQLIAELSSLRRVIVAFSGGVDSTFLLKMAKDTLGKENVIAVIAVSSTYPEKEKKEAINFCLQEVINYILIKTDEMDDARFTENDANRCYYCKLSLYKEIEKVAEQNKIENIIEGSNYDDLSDYRPGRKAIIEKGIKSPLLNAKLTKNEIRTLSKELGLNTHAKPAKACLASRVPYGTKITPEILKKIEMAENYIEMYGVSQVRVRTHQNIARIEVLPEDFNKILNNRDKIVNEIKLLGFNYVTLDLLGYRTGSLNEVL